MKIRSNDYKPGDVVGSHGMTLLSRIEAAGRPKAFFVCGRCGSTTRPIAIYDVASGRTVSCGCRQRETGRENMAKRTPEVRRRISQAGAASISIELCRANGRKSVASLHAHPNTIAARKRKRTKAE